ncbi:MAG: YabP/YqfC family sporulation protein [Clostridia bacterium]|nr:YabP/YqfC family sporulation protein [Clostridia bacterium]
MAEQRKKRKSFLPPRQNCITVQSGKWLMMEAVDQIVHCDPCRIVLKGAMRLEITGEGLSLAELGNDNMAVRGLIRSVEFFEE